MGGNGRQQTLTDSMAGDNDGWKFVFASANSMLDLMAEADDKQP